MFLLKFGQKEHIYDLYENGTIYCQSIDYFQNLEKQGLRGDKYEGTIGIKNYSEKDNFTLELRPHNSNDRIKVDAKHLHLREFLEDIKGNLFCLYALKLDDLTKDKKFKIDPRVKEFGTHVLFITDWERFLDNIKIELNKQGIVFGTDFVKYYSKKEINGKLDLFNKPLEFEYQKEYRMILQRKSKEPFIFKIGSMKEYAKVFDIDSIDNIEVEVLENDENNILD